MDPWGSLMNSCIHAVDLLLLLQTTAEPPSDYLFPSDGNPTH
jgi:hypothetical protein